MSQLAVAEFLNAAAVDPALLSRVATVGSGRTPVEAGEAISALGAEAGFKFSAADALSVREVMLNKAAGRSEGEDSVLEGVRGGSGSGDPYLDQQINTMTDTFAAMAPNSTGVIIQIAAGAAQGNAGGAAIEAANSMNETRNNVQEFFKSIFSGW